MINAKAKPTSEPTQPKIIRDPGVFPQINHLGGMPHFIGGLSKREYFAAMAMQGLLANPLILERMPGMAEARGIDLSAKNIGSPTLCPLAIEYADHLIELLVQK
jgi:hypothetical protein